MFKWPGKPAPEAFEHEVHEMADFVELQTWQRSGMSMMDLIRFLEQNADPDYSTSVPEDTEEGQWTENIYTEIERRKEGCGTEGYPFEIKRNGHRVEILQGIRNHRYIIYKYLLLATRLNMRDNKTHKGIDGTKLFEELAAEIAREYFGPRAESFVFGTAAGGANFQKKIDYLCTKLNEGSSIKAPDRYRPNIKDGKLDIVVWTSFTDDLPGKFIGFGQCKTGTNYKNYLNELQPDSFCRKWLQPGPVFIPIRLFFVSEALPRNGWYDMAIDAGLLFDRCRILDFSQTINKDLLEKIKLWTEAAAKSTYLPGL